MKSIVLFSVTLLVLFSSCSKDAMNAKKIEGIWTVNSLMINNIEFISVNSTVETTFTYKTGNSGRYNTRTHLFNVLAGDVSGDFIISDNGSKITLDEDGSSESGTGDIIELTDTYLHVIYVDGDNNYVEFKATKK